MGPNVTGAISATPATGSTGSAAGGNIWGSLASSILGAVVPILGSLVAGFFKDHSPEWYFDNGTDKTNQYWSGTGGNPSWMNDQITHARKGIIGLYQKGTIASYAGGAALYYLPFYAFDMHFNGTKGVETWKGDTDLQNLAIALYMQGQLPIQNMVWPKRPNYKITDGIQAMQNSDLFKRYLAMTNQSDPAATKVGSAVTDVKQAIGEAQAGAADWIKKNWLYLLLAIPVLPIIMLFAGRRR